MHTWYYVCYTQNDSTCRCFEHGGRVSFDHDEFECIERCKFLHLTILLNELTMCITVRIESTTVWQLVLDKFDHRLIYKVLTIILSTLTIFWTKIYLMIVLVVELEQALGIPCIFCNTWLIYMYSSMHKAVSLVMNTINVRHTYLHMYVRPYSQTYLHFQHCVSALRCRDKKIIWLVSCRGKPELEKALSRSR